MKRDSVIGHLAAAGAYTIFGLNILTTKDLATASGLSPMCLFTFRAFGASVLFWLASAFIPKEKVEKRDFPKIALASFIGFFVVQVAFLVAIPVSTAVDTAIMGTLSPVLTMLFAAIFIKEPITVKKISGVLLSLSGILWIILNSTHAPSAAENTSLFGFALLFINIAAFAAYLGIFKPLIAKYSVVTFMKWIFLIAFVLTTPFTIGEIIRFDYATLPPRLIWELVYLVVMATFVAYFLIPVAQKRIRPTLVSMYTYVQPIITAAAGILAGNDSLSPAKAVAAVMVCAGVAIVNASRSAS